MSHLWELRSSSWFSAGSSLYSFCSRKREVLGYESSEPRTLAGMSHEIWPSEKLVLSGENDVGIKGAQEYRLIKMLWQASQLFLSKWFSQSGSFDSAGVPAPFLFPVYMVVASCAYCWHIMWEIVWLHLGGKWLFAAVWLLNRSWFIRCFYFTGKKCLLLSAWSLSQPIHLCYSAVEEKTLIFFI